MHCRFCNTELQHIFIDLVNSPASNSFLTTEQLDEPETFFPLKVYTCHKCYLVQIGEFKKSQAIFNNEYVYFSSFSRTWLEHAEKYTSEMIRRFGFNSNSLVVELASNDGYLLQYFKKENINVLGIEPTANTAEVAIKKGIETIIDFFGTDLAAGLSSKGMRADLLIGNNVLAHVPDILDFVAGMKMMLKPEGVITMEFPHLVKLIDGKQFDTIYHEHFSYLSFYTVKQIFESQDLEIFDVEELTTHGGSLRIYAKHESDKTKTESKSVTDLLNRELKKGINTLDYYKGFTEAAFAIKMAFINFLINVKKDGKTIAAYGAAAKGNTLLNYCGIKNDIIDFVVDANPYKQNKWLPASHIPVKDESYLKKMKPDFVIILPWNLKDEITVQLSYIKEWGGRFLTVIPELQQI